MEPPSKRPHMAKVFQKIIVGNYFLGLCISLYHKCGFFDQIVKFLLFNIFFHIGYLTFWRNKYNCLLRINRQTYRWIQYGMSNSLFLTSDSTLVCLNFSAWMMGYWYESLSFRQRSLYSLMPIYLALIFHVVIFVSSSELALFVDALLKTCIMFLDFNKFYSDYNKTEELYLITDIFTKGIILSLQKTLFQSNHQNQTQIEPFLIILLFATMAFHFH